MIPSRPASSSSGAVGKKGDRSTPRQMSSDSFAGLTGLVKSKKAWNTSPQVPVPVANGHHFRAYHTLTPTPTPTLKPTPTPIRKDSAQSKVSVHIVTMDRDHDQMLDAKPINKVPASPAPTTMDKPSYDEEVMEKMENMIAEMSRLDTETHSGQDDVSTQRTGTQAHKQVESTFETLLHMVETAETVPKNAFMVHEPSEVSLLAVGATEGGGFSSSPGTQSASQSLDVQSIPPAWDSTTDQMIALNNEITEGPDKASSLERDSYPGGRQTDGRHLIGASREIDELRYRLQVNKDHKAIMSRDIRQKDVELLDARLELEGLKEKVLSLEAVSEQRERLQSEVDYWRNEAAKASKDATTADMSHAYAEQMAQVVNSKDEKIEALEKSLAQYKIMMVDHQKRAENLAETQSVRESKMRHLEQQLRDSYDNEEKNLDTIDHLKTEVQPLKIQAKKLESQVREQTSNCDRLRNDLKHTERRLDVANKALLKIENHQQLKGAAHLIVPHDQTKLPKLVLACLDCFAKNLPCDSNTRCYNCDMSGQKCRRWRCSQVHILRKCPDLPCLLTHDSNGWLMLKQEQPQW